MLFICFETYHNMLHTYHECKEFIINLIILTIRHMYMYNVKVACCHLSLPSFLYIITCTHDTAGHKQDNQGYDAKDGPRYSQSRNHACFVVNNWKNITNSKNIYFMLWYLFDAKVIFIKELFWISDVASVYRQRLLAYK